MNADAAAMGLRSGELKPELNTHKIVTLRVSLSVIEALLKKGKFGESWNDVLERTLKCGGKNGKATEK